VGTLLPITPLRLCASARDIPNDLPPTGESTYVRALRPGTVARNLRLRASTSSSHLRLLREPSRQESGVAGPANYALDRQRSDARGSGQRRPLERQRLAHPL